MVRRSSSIRSALHALSIVVICIFLQVPVHAEPVLDRVLAGAAVTEMPGCSLIRVDFNFRVRYQSHFPGSNGRELRVSVRAIDDAAAASQNPVRRESLRPPIARHATIAAIEFDIDQQAGPTLSIYFRDPVYFKIGQRSNFTSIVIAVSGRKPSNGCSPELLAGAAEAPAEAENTRREVPSAAGKPTGQNLKRELSAENMATIAGAMKKAKAALAKKELTPAIQLLTKVLTYPEHKYSAEALELLGLARERKGQLAHAKAEYESYLVRYPEGNGAARVRQRLAGILTSRKTPNGQLRKAQRASAGPYGDVRKGTNWSISGSWSEFYFRDESFRTFRDSSLPPNPNEDPEDREVFQNELLSAFDLIAKWENPNHQSKIRFSGANEQGFDGDRENETSVASLFWETSLTNWDVLTRIGRQTRNTGGVLGRFDGGLLSWQQSEKIQLNGVIGSPVVSRKDDPFEDDVFFYGVSVDYKPFDSNLDTSWFFIDQRADGLVDRQAIGAEFRYFDETKTAFATVDYDIHFDELNTAIFSGSWAFPDKSVLALGADYRKSPSLFTTNSLQGQQLDNLRDLLGIFSEDEIRRIALDRTATSESATIGYSRPLNDMFQVNLDATWYNISSTNASAGVDAILSTGDEYFYSAQLLATNVIKQGDIFVAGARYADRANSDFYTIDLNTRYPVTRKLRLNPRVRLTYRENKFDDGDELAVLPSLRLNYDYTRTLSFEVEAGAKWSLREQGTVIDEENEFFIILGFRYDFHTDERGARKW